MAQNLLFDFPSELLLSICQMVSFVDLARLDSAVCHHKCRHSLHAAFMKCHHAELLEGYDMRKLVKVEWLASRGIGVCNIALQSSDLIEAGKNPILLEAFHDAHVVLKTDTGRKMRSFSSFFRRGEEEETEEESVAPTLHTLHCRKLTLQLKCYDKAIIHAFTSNESVDEKCLEIISTIN